MFTGEFLSFEELEKGWESTFLQMGQRIFDLTWDPLIRQAFEDTPLANSFSPQRTFSLKDPHYPGHPKGDLHCLSISNWNGGLTSFAIQEVDRRIEAIFTQASGYRLEAPEKEQKRLLHLVYLKLWEINEQVQSDPELRSRLAREVELIEQMPDLS